MPVAGVIPADDPQAAATGSDRSARIKRNVIEWGVIIAVAVIAALLLRAFVVQPYFIPSDSMYPTLKDGDKVLVNKVSYHMHPIHRGDVVVFKTPPNDHSPGIKDLIKRVIGLPGETIQSGPNGEILINGNPIKQPWLTASAKAGPGPPVPKMTLTAGEYFVMGDNRGDSSDSRVFGPISRSLIVGRAFVIVWPVSRIGGL
ncbi:MAG TPA: signal peptidase I [Acidimicrobiales bacterium]|nr:signal peptidase I [Acidimicrobiales bacterium]